MTKRNYKSSTAGWKTYFYAKTEWEKERFELRDTLQRLKQVIARAAFRAISIPEAVDLIKLIDKALNPQDRGNP